MAWGRLIKLMKRSRSFLATDENEAPNFLIHGELHTFPKRSLFFLTDTNPFRILMLKIALWKYFDYFITFNIFMNSVLLCFYDYSTRLQDPNNLNPPFIDQIVDQSEFYFTGLFITEALIKIIGMGFFLQKRSYLRDSWNVADFIIVLAGIVAFLPDVPQFTILRCVRMLRPLRSITRIPGMRQVVTALIDSFPHLISVACVLLFFIFAFSLLGLQMFAGLLNNRCRVTPAPVNSTWSLVDSSDHRLCGYRTCKMGNCGNPLRYDMEIDGKELDDPDFNWNLTNFDNLGQAFLIIFQSITGEGWSSILYLYWNAYNAFFSSVFFCAVIIIGNFFMVNLILAAINNSFIEFNRKEDLVLMRSNRRERTDSPLSPQVTTAKLRERMKVIEPERIKKHIIYKICYKIAYNPIFVVFSLMIILGNSILLGLNRYPMLEEDTAEIEKGLTVFILYFVVELIIRVTAIGIRHFCKDLENLIEIVTLILGLSNFIYEQVNLSRDLLVSDNNMLKAVRCLMLLRIVKVMNFFKSIKLIIKTIKRTIWKMLDFVIVVVIFMSVCALIGMQLFAYRVRFDSNNNPSTTSDAQSPRVNCDNFAEAFLMAFALFVGDNWYNYQFDAIRAYSENSRLYFLIVVYLGNLTLINVFTAILINTFSEESEKIRKNYKKAINTSQTFDYEQFWIIKLRKFKPVFRRFFEKNLAFMMKILLCFKNMVNSVNVKVHKIKNDRFSIKNLSNFFRIMPLTIKTSKNLDLPTEKIIKRGASKSVSQYNRIAGIISSKGAEKPAAKTSNITSSKNRWSILSNFTGMKIFNKARVRKPSELLYQNEYKNNIFLSIEQSYRNNLVDFEAFNEKVKSIRRKDHKTRNLNEEFNIMSKIKADYQTQLEGKSLNFFGPNNNFRILCKKALCNPFFESMIMFFIILSCLLLAVNDPLSDPTSSLNTCLYGFDMLIAIIFLMEIIIKTCVFGFIFNGKTSYLRNGWNVFDFIISFFCVFATLQALETNLSALKSLRLARILKALRLIPSSEGLKLTINSFLRALPTLFNLILLLFSFFYICSVFLVNNFKGAFHYCTIGSYDKTDCFDVGGDWVNQDFNMDNVWMAMACLLAISTTDNWMQTMFNMMDSVGIDKTPVLNYGIIWKYFSIAFISISTFVVLNLFTSLVVDSYQREKDKGIGISSVSHQQKEWIKLQMRIFSMAPRHNIKIANHRLKQISFKIVNHKVFRIIIIASIILNTAIYGIQPIGMNQSTKNLLNVLNNFFFGIMIIESLLKIIAFGKSFFTSTPWNVFDLFIIIVTLISFYTESHHTFDSYGASMSSIRSFRLFRIFKLFNHYKGLKTVMNTLSASLSSLAHIGSLIILVLFSYSIIGMNAFCYVRFQSSISPDANFQSFKIAFMTLLRIATGEGWGGLMSDYARLQSPNFVCVEIKSYQDFKNANGNLGCGTSWAYLFFFSFEVLFKMIVLNLFIAVILQSFEDYNQRTNFIVNDEKLHQTRNAWKVFDSEALGLIPMKNYAKFIYTLSEPLGIDREKGETLMKYSISLGIPIYMFKYSKKKEYFFFYYDFLLSASKKAVLTLYEDDILEPINRVRLLEKLWRDKMRHLMKIKNLVVTSWDVSDYLATQFVHRFLNNCRHEVYKAKKLQFMKNKLKSLSYIDLPPLTLKKNASSKKKVSFFPDDNEEEAEKTHFKGPSGIIRGDMGPIIEEREEGENSSPFGIKGRRRMLVTRDDMYNIK